MEGQVQSLTFPTHIHPVGLGEIELSKLRTQVSFYSCTLNSNIKDKIASGVQKAYVLVLTALTWTLSSKYFRWMKYFSRDQTQQLQHIDAAFMKNGMDWTELHLGSFICK